jgi:hypothetical protein
MDPNFVVNFVGNFVCKLSSLPTAPILYRKLSQPFVGISVETQLAVRNRKSKIENRKFPSCGTFAIEHCQIRAVCLYT